MIDTEYKSSFFNQKDHEWQARKDLSDPYSISTGYKEQMENVIEELYTNDPNMPNNPWK